MFTTIIITTTTTTASASSFSHESIKSGQFKFYILYSFT